MPSGVDLPLLLGIYIFIGLLIALGVYLGMTRRRELRHLAEDLGFRFSAKDIWNIPKRYEFIELFATGSSRRARNVVYSSHGGAEIKIFDYSCNTNVRNNKEPHRLSFVVFDFQGHTYPHTHLTIKNTDEWLLDNPGLEEFNDCSKEFNEHYSVRGEDKNFIELFLTSDVQMLLLRIKCVGLDISESSFVFYCDGVVKTDILRDIHMIGWKMRRLIPDELLAGATTCKLPETEKSPEEAGDYISGEESNVSENKKVDKVGQKKPEI